MAESSIDPTTTQWRENFTRLFESEAQRTHESLQSLISLAEKQNNRVRKNELAIASLKTWVALIGGITGMIRFAAAFLQSLP